MPNDANLQQWEGREAEDTDGYKVNLQITSQNQAVQQCKDKVRH